MSNFNMQLVEHKAGTKITVDFTGPHESLMTFTCEPYQLNIYENMLIIEYNTKEDYRSFWIPLEKVLKIEECLYKTPLGSSPE